MSRPIRSALLALPLFFSLEARAQSGDTAPVVFDNVGQRVVARVTPGAKTYWTLGGTQLRSGHVAVLNEFHAGADDDGDGSDSWMYGRALPEQAAYAVVDSTGRLLTAVQASWSMIDWNPVPTFELGPNGKLSRLIMLSSGPFAGVLWVRPGVGGWKVQVSDSSSTDADVPQVANRRLVTLAGSFTPIGDGPPPPDQFLPGDVVVAIDSMPPAIDARVLPAGLAPTAGAGQLVINPSSAALFNPTNFFRESSPLRVWLDRVGGSDGTISVRCSTADGTAKAGLDYVESSTTLTFGPGEYLKSFTIPLIDDQVYAGSRTITVNFAPEGTTMAPGNSITYSFADDDPPPSAFINDVTAVEGDSGTQTATLTVSLAGPTRVPASVGWFIRPNGPGGTLLFQPGETSKPVGVSYAANVTQQPDRIIEVALLDEVDATVAKRVGTVTILDDDTPRLTVDDLAVNEGATANAAVKLLKASSTPVTVNYATADGTAKAGSDYVATSGALTFAPGETAKSIPVHALADAVVEPAEEFSLSLSSPSGATIARGTATVVVVDSAPPLPAISIAGMTVREGSGFPTHFDVSVLLSAPSSQPILVTYRIVEGTAKEGADYVLGQTPRVGQLTFAPGETSKKLDLAVIADYDDEPDETFFVDLSAVVNATIAQERTLIVIQDDDDPAPVFTVSDLRITEGNSGRKNAVFSFEISPPQSQLAVSAQWQTVDGTAKAGEDYIAASGVATFQPGETRKEVLIEILGDTIPEADETFTLRLPTLGALVGPPQVTCTIVDDDTIRPPRHRSVGH